jgi:hypothetical protein
MFMSKTKGPVANSARRRLPRKPMEITPMIRQCLTRRDIVPAAAKAAGSGARRACRSRPALEPLEGRMLLSFAGSEHRISLNPQATANFQSDNASSSNGASVAVWVNAYSATDHDIWAQRFDQNGQAAGAPIQVDFLSSDDSYAPRVAMDASGRFAVAWENRHTDGSHTVMMRYYDPLGAPLTDITRVSDVGLDDYNPDVALSVGSLVISWTHQFSPTDADIQAARYVISGGVPTDPVRIFVNNDTRYEISSSVAMNPTGRFDIVYARQIIGSDWDIYGSQYADDGSVLHDRVPINTDVYLATAPSVSMDNNGNAVVAYEEENAYGTDFGIFANRWSAGNVVSGRITVRDAFGGEYVPSVALARTGGQFVVAYNTDNGLQVTEVGANNAPLTTLGPVTENADIAAASIDGFNRFIVTATRFNAATNHDDIFSRRDFLPSGVETLVNPSTGVFTQTDFQSDNASSPGNGGVSVAVWVNNVGGDNNDIYAQRYDNLGRPLGGVTTVDSSGANSQNPHVSIDVRGRFAVTWTNLNADGTSAIMYRYYNSNGAALTPVRRLSPAGTQDFDSDVAATGAFFTISYTHTVSATNHDILAEQFIVSGTTVTPQGIFAVNNDANDEGRSSVAMSPSGRTTIAYQRQFSGSDWDILASQYNRAVLVRRNILVNFDGVPEFNPSVSADVDGNVVVAYQRTNNGETGIYANRVAWADGTVSSMITIRDAAGVSEVNPSVALSQTTGHFVVSYQHLNLLTNRFGVTEINGANTVVANSGAFTGFSPALSIDGLNRYMVTYTRYNSGTNSLDIFSRRNFLS